MIGQLIGKTLTAVDVSPDGNRITFAASDGSTYAMFHQQDCCENVYVEDITGDLTDLLSTPIVMAEESSSSECEAPRPSYADESCTWTFYKLATAKGYVTIRWFGSSNGYYSESVDFVETKAATK